MTTSPNSYLSIFGRSLQHDHVIRQACLNLRTPRNGSPLYDITRPDAEQLAILEALGLQKLAEDDDLRTRITQRPLSAG